MLNAIKYSTIYFISYLFYSTVLAQPVPTLDITLTVNPPAGKIIVHFATKSNSLKFWKDSNSWGWDNVRFILIRNHVPFYFRRNPEEPFTRNIPAFEEISKSKGVDRIFSFFDGNWVASEGAPKDISSGDTVICAYAVNPSHQANEKGVWVGTACGIVDVEKK